MNNRRNIKKLVYRVLIALVAIFVFFIGYTQYSHIKHHQDIAYKIDTLATGQKNLATLIEYQDKHFQKNGSYKQIDPATNLSHIKNFKTCTQNCTPCEYSVKATKNNFTATAKCVGKDGDSNFSGYIRTKPGELAGIDGHYAKCKAEGVYAGNRNLVNTIGPCFKQDNDYMSIMSGTKKRLIIETLPNNVEISINGSFVGTTSESHNATTNSYGSFFISEPVPELNLVTLTKQGYEPITFPINWGSYTYKATVVLNASSH